MKKETIKKMPTFIFFLFGFADENEMQHHCITHATSWHYNQESATERKKTKKLCEDANFYETKTKTKKPIVLECRHEVGCQCGPSLESTVAKK
jgi:hypothetical protein